MQCNVSWVFSRRESFQEGKNEEKELDLDELLDVDDEVKRRKFLWDTLSDCKQSKDKVEVSLRQNCVSKGSECRQE